MPNDFPHSPQYFARQAARQKAIERERARILWTDAQFLAERDAVYIAEQRELIQYKIETQERYTREDNDSEGYMAFYHTDEG